VGLEWAYSGARVELQWAYSGARVEVQWGYGGSTVGLQWGYSWAVRKLLIESRKGCDFVERNVELLHNIVN
jgi:hypothetical protein